MQLVSIFADVHFKDVSAPLEVEFSNDADGVEISIYW